MVRCGRRAGPRLWCVMQTKGPLHQGIQTPKTCGCSFPVRDRTCSQKIHNLLYAYRQIPDDIEVLAFADSDICVRPDWLSHLVHRLRLDRTGATTGYRWYVPKKNNFATLALVATNAKIAQLLGNTIFNHAWGGSMAIKVQTFRELGIDKIWQKAVSDDLSLSCAVKDAHKKVEFVPGCLVATLGIDHLGKVFRVWPSAICHYEGGRARRRGVLGWQAVFTRCLGFGAGRLWRFMRPSNIILTFVFLPPSPSCFLSHNCQGDTETKYGKQTACGGLAEAKGRGRC